MCTFAPACSGTFAACAATRMVWRAGAPGSCASRMSQSKYRSPWIRTSRALTMSAGCVPTLPYCNAAQAIGRNDDSCGNQCSQVTFTCPPTGHYRLLTAAFSAGEAYTCRFPFAM